MDELGPTITLPNNTGRVAQLKAKLEEYKNRIDPYQAPQLQMAKVYSAEILERLLKEGEVKTFDLARELQKKYDCFEVDAFNNACEVIRTYASEGGLGLTGGTGLPVLNQ